MGRLVDTEDLMVSICKEYDRKAVRGQGLQLAWIEKAVNDTPTATRPTPCDVCIYNPPSSMDGKPCSVCPAEGRVDE